MLVTPILLPPVSAILCSPDFTAPFLPLKIGSARGLCPSLLRCSTNRSCCVLVWLLLRIFSTRAEDHAENSYTSEDGERSL